MERERKEEPKTLSGVIWSWIIVLFSLFTVVPALGPYSRVGTLVIVVFAVVSAWRSYKSFMKIRAGGGVERPRPSPPPVETHDHIPSTALDTKRRLENLESLKAAGLVDKQEYGQLRERILKEQ